MKKIIFTVILLALPVLAAVSQTGINKIILESCTYSTTNPSKYPGKIIWRHSDGRLTDKCDFLISGSDAEHFEIKNGRLTVKKSSIKALDNKPFAQITLMAKVNTHIMGVNDFTIVNDRFARNRTIAHRGAWKVANVPQNSIASLQEAQKLTCAGSEIDVYMTSDSLIILNHDRDHQGMNVETNTAAELRSKPLKNGEPLPFLSDILAETKKGYDTKLIIEIKSSSVSKAHGIKSIDKVVEMVHNTQSQAWVEYIAFDYDLCKRILFLDPFAKVAFLNGDIEPNALFADGITGFDYHLDVLKKNPLWMRAAQNLGLTTNVWTVNNPEDMENFLKQGVDVITTDEPGILIEKVKASSAKNKK